MTEVAQLFERLENEGFAVIRQDELQELRKRATRAEAAAADAEETSRREIRAALSEVRLDEAERRRRIDGRDRAAWRRAYRENPELVEEALSRDWQAAA